MNPLINNEAICEDKIKDLGPEYIYLFLCLIAIGKSYIPDYYYM